MNEKYLDVSLNMIQIIACMIPAQEMGLVSFVVSGLLRPPGKLDFQIQFSSLEYFIAAVSGPLYQSEQSLGISIKNLPLCIANYR